MQKAAQTQEKMGGGLGNMVMEARKQQIHKSINEWIK